LSQRTKKSRTLASGKIHDRRKEGRGHQPAAGRREGEEKKTAHVGGGGSGRILVVGEFIMEEKKKNREKVLRTNRNSGGGPSIVFCKLVGRGKRKDERRRSLHSGVVERHGKIEVKLLGAGVIRKTSRQKL